MMHDLCNDVYVTDCVLLANKPFSKLRSILALGVAVGAVQLLSTEVAHL